MPPIWCSVRGQLTPWIAYRGCFYEKILERLSLTWTHLSTSSFHYLVNNSAGNFYSQCKSKNYTNGGFANKANVFFGLQKSACLCLCNNTNIPNISESVKCNFLCGTSIKNGEYVGLYYFSLYETMDIKLP